MQASVISHCVSFLISFGCCYTRASDSPAPSMLCPAVQFGREGQNITCVTSVAVSSISMSRNGTKLVECNTTTCSGRKGYTGLVTKNDTHLVLSMTIEKVEARDESTLTCGVDVNGESVQIEATCSLFLYVPPEKPLCSYTFNESHALVTCSTANVYPPAKCVWTAFSEPKLKFTTVSSAVRFLGGTIHLYNSTCTASFPITYRTNYQLNVSFFPTDLGGKDLSRGAAVETQGIFLLVKPPADAPLLNVTPTQSEYMESDNVTIFCSVLGGRPSVYSTSLHCDSEYVDTATNSSNVTVQGQVVTMSVQLTGIMHNKSCTCSGRHVYPNYHSQNMLTFKESEVKTMNSSEAESTLKKYSISIAQEYIDLLVCPKDFQIKHTALDLATLSWTSSNPVGLDLIYTMIYHVETERPTSVYRIPVGEVNVTRDSFVEYNISLSKLRSYNVGNNASNLLKLNRHVFSLDIENKECPQVRLNVAPEAEGNQISLIQKLGLTGILIITLLPGIEMVIIILVIIIWKGRRNQVEIRRENNCQPVGCGKRGDPEPVSRTAEPTLVNDTYNECVPAEPNIEHPYELCLQSEVVK